MLTFASQPNRSEEGSGKEEDRCKLIEADAADVHASDDATDFESGCGDEGEGEDCGEWT